MLILILTLFLAGIVTVTNSLIVDKKITLISFGEFSILSVLFIIIDYFNLNDFAIFYSVIVVVSISNKIIRKRAFQTTNVVFTIFTFTFVVIEIPIYIYQMLITQGTIERLVEGYISTSIIILFSMVMVSIVYFITSRFIKYTDEFINTKLTVYNIIVLFSIIAVNRFISRLNILNDFYFETIIIMFVTILVFILFLYASMHVLQKLNVLLASLSKENKKTQDETINAFRKNHNATNLLITVNHLIKEREYDLALKYIQNEK